MSQFLAARNLIIACLASQLTCKVRLAIDLDFVIKNALSPSVSVIFFDDVPDENPNAQFMQGKQQASHQFWLVVVSVRNVADIGNASLEEVGVIADTVLTALQGAKLSDQHTPLRRVKSPYRQTSIDGYTHLPLMFTTKIIIGSPF
jgi:hypothetical protein